MCTIMNLKYVHFGTKNNSLRIMKMAVLKELIVRNVMAGKNTIFIIRFIKLNNVINLVKLPGIAQNIIKMRSRELYKKKTS